MKPFVLLCCFVLGCLLMAAYSFRSTRMGAAESRSGKPEDQDYGVEITAFGTTSEGEAVSLFTCRNKHGLVLQLMDWGATVVAIHTPDRQGNMSNIVLSCPDLDGFQKCTMYFNSTIGRYANRIAGGQFTLNGQNYQLATNNGPNHLHGGERGFDKRLWKYEVISNPDEVGVTFHYFSPDGEEGFPGNVNAQVRYVLNNDNELVIEYRAETDRATPINLTNHNYWNLAGQGDILGHVLQLYCDYYLPIDETSIPLGELRPVADTPFDFRKARKIGDRIAELANDPRGYDHCYVVNGEHGKLRIAAHVLEPSTGRTLTIWTTEPGIQFYSGNYLNGLTESAGYPQYSGFCLETQHFPDSPNQSNFPSTILQPGDRYFHKSVHKFDVVR